jgi:hypothetical protein
MLAKAHCRSPGSVAGRIARLGMAALMCAAAILLASHAEASAANPLTRTLDAIAHTSASDVSSTVSTAVGPAVGAPPPSLSPSVPVAAATAPPNTSVSEQTLPPADPPPSSAAPPLHAVTTSLGDASREASSHLTVAPGAVARPQSHQAPTTPAPPTAERDPVSAILHTVVRRDPPGHLVGDVLHRATTAVAGTQAVTTVVGVLARTSGGAPIVRSLASDVSSVVGGVARAGATVGSLANSVLDPAVPSLRSLGFRAPSSPTPAPQPPASAASASGTSRSSSASGHDPLVAVPSAQLAAGRWSVAAANPPLTSAPSPAGAPPTRHAPAWPSPMAGTQLLPGEQGAVSPPAHGTPLASLPASPAPTPPSPGGVSPATAAGSGGGIAVALALAALLLLAAPPAVSRLRLVAERWRRAPLLLIAARPG